jgi:hypothetical protein
MTRRKRKPASPRKKAGQSLPYIPEYAFAGGWYWCANIGLLPVIEPYINAGGVNGYGFGIRVAWFGGNAFAEWWKP